MTFARLEIVRIVRGCDLDRARAELWINKLVCDDRNLAPRQGQLKRRANQIAVAFVVRIDRNGCVAKHRFGPRRRHNHTPGAALDRILQVIKFSSLRFLLDLQVRERGLIFRTPTDQTLAVIDQTLFITTHEEFAHGAR